MKLKWYTGKGKYPFKIVTKPYSYMTGRLKFMPRFIENQGAFMLKIRRLERESQAKNVTNN